MKIVLFPPVEAHRIARFEAISNGHEIVNAQNLTEATMAMKNADGFMGKITPVLLANSSCLKWVQSMTASLEHYIFPELVNHPSILTNMRGIFSDVVADHAIGMVLSFSRNLHRYILQQSKGKWAPLGGENGRVDFASGPGVTNSIDLNHQVLSENTIGVFGLGGIGREIAKRGAAFGMRCIGLDPFCQEPSKEVPEPWSMDRLDEFLRDSDYVVIAAPHTPLTEKLFNFELISKMKTNSVLINIGRGAIVILDDLVKALNQGLIAGAGLDVFEIEPLPESHPLWKMNEKVILTPHVAGYAPPIASRHLGFLESNLNCFLNNRPLMNIVDKSRWF
ncbi:MAG: D-2-hydroxyacid dehydrogenase [Gemmataceae bacterium]